MPTEERHVFEATLRESCSGLGLPLADRQCELLWGHYARMVEANSQFNLTRITGPAEAAIKHYADSLALLACPWIQRARRLQVLDVGTGAGFPAIPLAICCPEWKLTAIDGTAKKARFVAEAAEALGIPNLTAEHARGDELARTRVGMADLIVLRAVGRVAPMLSEVHRLARGGGLIVCYKTRAMPAEELAEARKAAADRRLKLLAPVPIEVPAPGLPDGPLRRQFIAFRV